MLGETLATKTVQVSYVDRPGVYGIPIEIVLSKRDGDAIVIDRGIVFPKDKGYIYPRLIEYDPSDDMFVYVWKRYIGKDYPRLFPKFEVVEEGPGYVVVRKGNKVYKVNDAWLTEILLNIYINSGKSLWDIVVLECMIEAKENPDAFEDENYRITYAKDVVEVIGFYVYIADLVDMIF